MIAFCHSAYSLPIAVHADEKHLEIHSLCSACLHLVVIPDAKHTQPLSSQAGGLGGEAVGQKRVHLPLGPTSKVHAHMVKP